MEQNKSELEKLIEEIRINTNQISVNKVDEIRVMQCMLNDPDFRLAVYDKNLGYIGEKCPHDNAVKFIKNIISGSTGLDGKDSLHLAEKYEFTKRDASFLIENGKDFLQVYMETGRKINVMQTESAEASLFTKEIKSSTKQVPDKENPGKIKTVKTSPYTKLVSASKCPKYENN